MSVCGKDPPCGAGWKSRSSAEFWWTAASSHSDNLRLATDADGRRIILKLGRIRRISSVYGELRSANRSTQSRRPLSRCGQQSSRGQHGWKILATWFSGRRLSAWDRILAPGQCAQKRSDGELGSGIIASPGRFISQDRWPILTREDCRVESRRAEVCYSRQNIPRTPVNGCRVRSDWI